MINKTACFFIGEALLWQAGNSFYYRAPWFFLKMPTQSRTPQITFIRRPNIMCILLFYFEPTIIIRHSTLFHLFALCYWTLLRYWPVLCFCTNNIVSLPSLSKHISPKLAILTGIIQSKSPRFCRLSCRALTYAYFLYRWL